jgi:hypothetical protein
MDKEQYDEDGGVDEDDAAAKTEALKSPDEGCCTNEFGVGSPCHTKGKGATTERSL